LFHTVDVFGERKPSLFGTLRKWLQEIPESFEDEEKTRQAARHPDRFQETIFNVLMR